MAIENMDYFWQKQPRNNVSQNKGSYNQTVTHIIKFSNDSKHMHMAKLLNKSTYMQFLLLLITLIQLKMGWIELHLLFPPFCFCKKTCKTIEIIFDHRCHGSGSVATPGNQQCNIQWVSNIYLILKIDKKGNVWNQCIKPHHCSVPCSCIIYWEKEHSIQQLLSIYKDNAYAITVISAVND